MNRVGALLLLVFTWLICSHGAESASTSDYSPRAIQIVLRNGETFTAIGDKDYSLKSVQPGSPPVTFEGISFSAGADGGIQVSSAGSFSVRFPGIGAWKADVQPDLAVTFQPDFEHNSVGVTMPNQTPKSVYLFCDSGGQVELKAGAKGNFTFFKNGCFLFKGSGNLLALDADGKPCNFLIPGASMSGGPLIKHTDPSGAEHWERASLTVPLTITGTPGKDLTITTDDGKAYQPKGGSSVIAIGDSGAKMVFTEELDGSVVWNVDGGSFEVMIKGIPAFRILANSGGSATLSWDKTRRLVHAKNISREPIQFTLPGRSYAAVNPMVEFQFAMVAPGIFSATAAGGDVQIYNGNGDLVASVEAGGALLDVKRLTAGLSSGRGIYVRLNWDNGQPLQANSARVNVQLPPGTEQILAFGNDGKLKLVYSSGGFLTAQAIRGNFTLAIEAVHGMTADLVEGDTVSLTLDLKKGTFTVKAGEDNINDVSVGTENGYTPVLEAARALNFNLGKQGWVASSGGQTWFYVPEPTPPVPVPPDPPVIPPASVIR